jgi:GNAT superfamily N-acetyltransferase
MNHSTNTLDQGVYLLSVDDLERVIAIDCAHSGHSRRRFFEKRFAAAKANPDDFVQIGLMRGGALRGYAIARLLRGEFGREDIVAELDAVGVAFENQAIGIGHDLIEGLVKIMRQRGVHSIHSQATWVNHDLLRFFDASGFKLSPRLVLERSVTETFVEENEEP